MRISQLVLYLNIYIALFGALQAQELSLQIKPLEPTNQHTIDSLIVINRFADFNSLKNQYEAIGDQLLKMGYLDLDQKTLQQQSDNEYIGRIELGNRWKELHLVFDPDLFPDRVWEQLDVETQNGRVVLPIEQTEVILHALNEWLIDQGDPFANVQLAELQKIDAHRMQATLVGTQHEARNLDGIVIRGYEKFPRSFLKYYSGIRIGKQFDQKKLLQQNELLNNLGFVSTSKAPEALFREDSTKVYLYLQKENNNQFDGILGFATNEETNKLELNGYLNLLLSNNLNYGERLLINYKADGREQQNLEANLYMPFMFKTPVGVELGLKIFKRDSTFSTTEQLAKVHYQSHPTTRIFVGYRSHQSSNLLDENLAGLPVEDYQARYFIGGISYAAQQSSAFFPIKTFAELSLDLGDRETDLDKQDQFRIQAELYHQFRLNYKNRVFLRNTTGILSSDTYLTNELFRFGGINSIRGFSENSIDASLYTVLNTEYRYLLNANTYIHSVTDLAFFQNQTTDLESELFSFGIGMGLQTRAGVLKFTIANGISDEQDFNFSTTKVHLSLSSRF